MSRKTLDNRKKYKLLNRAEELRKEFFPILGREAESGITVLEILHRALIETYCEGWNHGESAERERQKQGKRSKFDRLSE